MTGKKFLTKTKRKLINVLLFPFLRWSRIIKYRLLSNCLEVHGKPKLFQPLLALGNGIIKFNGNVHIGVISSPYFFSTYAHIEARKEFSKIVIESGVWINNNACLISEGQGISIGEATLIGSNFCAFDSDFHELDPNKRMSGFANTAPIIIGKNVFIGSNVTVLKGVMIGDNSVIANSSVLTKSIPENVIAGGNPCKVIKQLNEKI